LPSSALILDAANNLYGTTQYGGTGTYECTSYAYGCGTVYTVDGEGNETVLYSFSGKRDGRYPEASLIMDSEGHFYGTTSTGGSHGFGCGCGTVFKLDRNGKETALYSFGNGSDGEYPSAGLVRDPEGNFYGTTLVGGKFGLGTVFKLSKGGRETVLYSFKGGMDGSGPYAGLVRDPAGNLYGTTVDGGGYKCYSDADCGTVFRVDKSGKEKVLHRFGGKPDGAIPYGNLTRDEDGSVFGVTTQGGAYNGGTIFKLDREGKETILYSFAGGADGYGPYAGLIRDAEGNLYGTNVYAGDPTCQCGVVFKITP
jgi:uncharacterized repeat protein (TIGR03803 family)